MEFPCCACTSSRKSSKKLKTLPTDTCKCANKKCDNTTTIERLSKWRPAIAGTKVYYFCSDECWGKWLSMAIETRPILDMSSPVTPAIYPRPSNDIPLINI